MLTKVTAVTTYYAIILVFLAFQAVLTVYEGSQVVSHGKTVAQLERDHHQLVNHSYQLKQQLAANNSLLHISSSPVYNQFQPMANVLKVEQYQTVASR